ncbi:TonB family protein [Porticoccaceae bacterium LTM1]|nr:TonB family protein [Porticoccaceae bacterium LTM1]
MLPTYRRVIAVLFLSLGIGTNSQAQDMPLNGAAAYQDLGKDRFLAALYLEAPSNNADTILGSSFAKRMEIRLTSDYSKRRWVNLWMQGMAINNNSNTFNKMANALVDLFAQQKGGVRSGDVVTIDLDPDKGCSYSINGITLASDQPAKLFDLFLNSWVGQVPPSSEFREGILGNVDTSLMKVKLSQITPNEERISAIQDWLSLEEGKEEVAAAEGSDGSTTAKADKKEVAAKSKPDESKADKKVAAAPAKKPEKSKKSEKIEVADAGVVPSIRSIVPEHEDDPVAKALQASAEQLAAHKQAALEAEQAQKRALEEEEDQEVSIEMILAMQEYTKSAMKQVYKSIKYPNSALRRGDEGQVRLSVQVDRNGELVNVEATQECDHSSLNREAIRAVKKAAPFNSLPEVITDSPLELTIPISFRLQ